MTQPKTKCTFDALRSWRAKNSYIWCVITWKSRFSHDAPNRWSFVGILRGKAGFLMTRQTLIFIAFIRGKAGFLMTRPKTKCTFDAIWHFEAGFLVTHKKLFYLMHYYAKQQVFSWRAQKVQICCIIRWKSRFSHDVPKTLIFDAIIRGKAGFLMKSANYSYIWLLILGKAGFLMKTKCTFDALLHFFLVTVQKVLYLIVNTWKSRFPHDATEKRVHFMYFYVM